MKWQLPAESTCTLLNNDPKNACLMILGNRRFQMLSPTLVRIEFSPNGLFEDRHSMLALPPRQPLEFHEILQEEEWHVLKTGAMEIWTTANHEPFYRLNLEIRWTDASFLQNWRPGDRDYQNLGGTLRSLDRYGGKGCQLAGVHPATMDSPDAIGTTWVAWHQDEVDPLYEPLHPAAPKKPGNNDWMEEVVSKENNGRYPARTFNTYQEALRFPPGLLSAAGYALLNDSDGAVLNGDAFPVERNRPGSQDWYFLAYGRNYMQALADFRLLSGPAPMLPRKTLGIMFSRWPAFTEAEIEDIVGSFQQNGYPLSTLVMDMEWHKEGWGHWEFDPKLIPDPTKFFARCRELGLDVTLNDHPLDVREDDVHFEAYLKEAGPGVKIRAREYQGKIVRMASVDICNPQQNRAFRSVCQTHLWKLGLSYWWNDGSRGQMRGTLGQLVSSKSFFEDSVREGRRGMHLARYGGLGSHRYGAFFTGDARSDYDVLRLQCEMNIRAAGAGLSHISHDIGGFALDSSEVRLNSSGKPIIEPVRYLRWLQFGVFNPILRFHSAPGCGSRRPEDYDEELGEACRHWLRVRHSLLPYLYTAMREYHEVGVPLTRGVFLMHPEDCEAYRFDEYYFGPDLLVCPILTEEGRRGIYLPEVAGGWWKFETAERLEGGGQFEGVWSPSEVPVYVKAGSVLPRQNPDGDVHPQHLSVLTLDVYPGANGRAWLYEDDGVSTRYETGEFCRTEYSLLCEGDEIRLSSQLKEGRPLGEMREVLLMLSLDREPVVAIWNEGSPLQWEVAEVAGRYMIRLPVHTASESWNLRVKMSAD